MYLNKRSKYRTSTNFVEKVALCDAEKKPLLKLITESLGRNKKLLTETYLTLMLIAFGKKIFFGEIQPTVDLVDEQIKKSKVW